MPLPSIHATGLRSALMTFIRTFAPSDWKIRLVQDDAQQARDCHETGSSRNGKEFVTWDASSPFSNLQTLATGSLA